MRSVKAKRPASIVYMAGCIFLSLFLLAGVAFAQEGGHGAEAGHGGEAALGEADQGEAAHGGGHGDGKIKDLIYRVINFTLLVIILVVVIRKTAIKDFFSARRKEIEQKFDDLERQKKLAEEKYQELDRALKEFEEKKKEIIREFEKDGAAEKEKIIAQAKERADQLLAQADLTIEREIQAARDRLRREFVDAAAQKAEDIISKQIEDSDQDRLVRDFIERVEKLN